MPEEKNIAVIDIGPGTVSLLIAKNNQGGSILPVNEFEAVIGLGKDLHSSRNLPEELISQTVKAASEMKEIAIEEGVEDLHDLVVTVSSVFKKAENKSKLMVKCHQKLDIYPQLLSAREEALFSFTGATYKLPQDQPAVLINIESATTELAWGTRNESAGTCSFNFGCVKLNETFRINRTNYFLKEDPAVTHIKNELRSVYSRLDGWLAGKKPVILASGGTATAYAAVHRKQYIYDREEVNATQSSRKDLLAIYKTISKIKSEKRYLIPGMPPERADSLPAGLLILHTIMKYFNLDHFRITGADMKLGIARHFMEHKPSFES